MLLKDRSCPECKTVLDRLVRRFHLSVAPGEPARVSEQVLTLALVSGPSRRPLARSLRLVNRTPVNSTFHQCRHLKEVSEEGYPR